MDAQTRVRCLILEDEPLGLLVLKDYITRLPFLEISSITSNGSEALQLIQSGTYELLFLDIQVPAVSGIELLKQLPNPPKVIFTTAFPQFAAEAFDLDAIDYLVKPFSFERFEKAVHKVLKIKHEYHPDFFSKSNLVETNKAFIYIKSGGVQAKIMLDQIVYVESQRNTLQIHLLSNRTVTTYLTINELEDRLPKALFLRIHKSFVISLDKIETFNSTQISVNGYSIPIGRSYKDMVLPVVAKLFE